MSNNRKIPTMKSIALLLTALLFAGSLRAQSRIEQFTLQSTILGAEKSCSIYLPDGYDASGKSYPVLYLLHGASGCHTDWQQNGNMRQILDEAIAQGTALPMIVVMPDAAGEGENRTGKHMGYFDVPDWAYEKFFFAEFLPTVETRYRIAGNKAQRAITGLSMGGGGAVVYAMHQPDLFGSACPLSGVLDRWSTTEADSNDMTRSVSANSPVRALESWSDEQIAPLRTVRWRVDCGDDDFLYQSNIRFYQLMRQRNIPLEYRMRDGGHSWRYWQTSLPEVLTFVSVGFAQ